MLGCYNASSVAELTTWLVCPRLLPDPPSLSDEIRNVLCMACAEVLHLADSVKVEGCVCVTLNDFSAFMVSRPQYCKSLLNF